MKTRYGYVTHSVYSSLRPLVRPALFTCIHIFGPLNNVVLCVNLILYVVCPQGPNPDDDVEEVTIVAGGTEKGKEPSRCVWAILSCCAPSNTPIRYTCFDVLGCSTAFWDTNPCVPAIIKTALDQATQFYGTGMSTNRTATPVPTPPAVPAAASTDNVASLMTGTSAAAASPVDQTTPAATTTAA